MQKIWIVTSIIVVVVVFIYWINVLSDSNKCSWVRIFESYCQKNKDTNTDTKTTSTWITSITTNLPEKYAKAKPTSDTFLKYCEPNVTEENNNYVFDYSNCDLKVSVNKEWTWIQKVVHNGKTLTRDEINNNFK